ncbi:MAG: SRPBCC family protein [Acidimicrobiales bacterium]
MEHRYVATIEAPRSAVAEVLTDIGTYDRWLDFVERVEASDGGWIFTLRAQVGPFARRKRLRVEETADAPLDHVRLERSERDDRDHAPWTFDAVLTPTTERAANSATEVTITLSYGGKLWTSLLATVLDEQLRTATKKLQTLAVHGGAG